ncbi:CPXCG motif-containing cysteine-rich protein [Nonlabens agnitus]|uniref:CPXCG motif-containing cysteine-rich protein n=1 Tax=Nonlabens agnitus TaxID=870484 RepID=A0A2S9WYA2_9FLAO|nr:CPXCG motif-containing cysteine-rich protein [Nonlabens agnitus]PRP68219.1 CPXCG motif-containing cysteine-rich protein [Nonlabens agnitus]PRP68441.1 CPXCG motif-containing cysteine-rich protein [Nonlabens agnitus]
MIEYFFSCPHCWQEISMLLDPAYSQTYVEDCEVCCNPIEITVQFEDGELLHFEAKEIGQ